jgi:hypothetical protein
MKFIIDNWVLISSLLGIGGTGGIIGFFSGKKKRKEELKLLEGNALDIMQKSYDTFTSDMKERYLLLRQELQEVKSENKEQRNDLRILQKDNSRLHIEAAQLTKENHELRQMVVELKEENTTLQNELKKYRKK